MDIQNIIGADNTAVFSVDVKFVGGSGLFDNGNFRHHLVFAERTVKMKEEIIVQR